MKPSSIIGQNGAWDAAVKCWLDEVARQQFSELVGKFLCLAESNA